MDLARRRADGESIDSRKVNKHKRDVFRLTAMLGAEERFAVPAELLSDVRTFAEMVRTNMPNSDALKAMGIHGAGAEEVLERMLVAFVGE